MKVGDLILGQPKIFDEGIGEGIGIIARDHPHASGALNDGPMEKTLG